MWRHQLIYSHDLTSANMTSSANIVTSTANMKMLFANIIIVWANTEADRAERREIVKMETKYFRSNIQEKKKTQTHDRTFLLNILHPPHPVLFCVTTRGQTDISSTKVEAFNEKSGGGPRSAVSPWGRGSRRLLLFYHHRAVTFWLRIKDLRFPNGSAEERARPGKRGVWSAISLFICEALQKRFFWNNNNYKKKKLIMIPATSESWLIILLASTS